MRVYYGIIYYLSWLVFGLVGLAVNLVSIVLLLVAGPARCGPWARRIFRFWCDLWFKGMHAAGILRVTWTGFDRPFPAGTVIVANHPTLIDAILIMARIEDMICIFKPRLMRNPALGPAAILGGYVSADGGIALVRSAASAVRKGRSLLIFPEGTRTAPGTSLGPLKAGFALIARSAGAPVQYVSIHATPGMTARGRPWWRLPDELPLWAHVTVDRRWEHDPACDASRLTEVVRARMLETLQP